MTRLSLKLTVTTSAKVSSVRLISKQLDRQNLSSCLFQYFRQCDHIELESILLIDAITQKGHLIMKRVSALLILVALVWTGFSASAFAYRGSGRIDNQGRQDQHMHRGSGR